MITGAAGFTASLMMGMGRQGVLGPHEEIVTNERYVSLPWKMVTRHGTIMTLKEAVDSILNQKESEAKELEIRNREKEEIENKHREYYEKHLKEETERLNESVDWYKCKL